MILITQLRCVTDSLVLFNKVWRPDLALIFKIKLLIVLSFIELRHNILCAFLPFCS